MVERIEEGSLDVAHSDFHAIGGRLNDPIPKLRVSYYMERDARGPAIVARP